MKVLVWHWGRYGAGPRFAVSLADGLRGVPGVDVSLSLASGAEILSLPVPPHCDWTEPTYADWPGFLARWAIAAAKSGRLEAKLRAHRPDLAICAMPAALDPLMLRALRRLGVPRLVIAHDAAPHEGDGGPARAAWDQMVLRRADTLAVLSGHVGAAVGARYPDTPLIRLWHPPFPLPVPPPFGHGGPPRVLCFGRLRAYKGLDLLAETLRGLPQGWLARVVGSGPEVPALDALRALPGVTVENRWVPEAELPALLGWADIVLLTHRAASQSGVAAAAIGAGRHVVAVAVEGLTEQLSGVAGARLCATDPTALATALRESAKAPPPLKIDAAVEWRRMAAALLAGARNAKATLA